MRYFMHEVFKYLDVENSLSGKPQTLKLVKAKWMSEKSEITKNS